MHGGVVHLSTGRPAMPDDADFGIHIDFKKGEPSPQRIFQAAIGMINALQRLDHALCSAVDNSIEPIMVLEEVEAGSLTIWVRNILQRTDDDALKKLDWKPLMVNIWCGQNMFTLAGQINQSQTER
jgi:hypothetical protein